MKTLALIISLITLPLSWAGYYDSKVQSELEHGSLQDKNLLSFIGRVSSKNFKPLGYKKRAKNELFGNVDLKEDKDGLYVFDVYCRLKIRKNNGVGRNRVPKNEVMNTEHTWPQSKGAKREPARGDLHHLFPTDSRANSARSNHIFAEVRGKDAHSNCPASQTGKAIGLKGYTTTTNAFEPPFEHRGNVARAMFYVVAKYNYQLSALEEYYLRKWAKEDPVDEEEIGRNGRIEEAQGNRNPFIDYPELVERISDF